MLLILIFKIMKVNPSCDKPALFYHFNDTLKQLFSNMQKTFSLSNILEGHCHLIMA